MAKNRKNATASISTHNKPSTLDRPNTKPLVEIPEDEQWRLIQESGVLNKVSGRQADKIPSTTAPVTKSDTTEQEAPLSPLEEEVFQAATLIIPFSFLLLLMNIMVNFQYKQQPDYKVIAGKMVTAIPILSIFIFYTNRHKPLRPTQAILFLISIACGGRLIWQVNRGSWTMNMQQSPPLATLWVYAVVQLELGRSVLSLLVIGIWTYLKGYKIIFD